MAVKKLEEISESAQTIYKRAKEAANRQNDGYVIDLLNQLLELEPAFFEGRKLLHSVQMRHFKNASMMARKMAGMGAITGAMKAQSTLKKNPAGALVEAEKVLNGDPANATALSVAADAAEAMDLCETAAFCLETLRQSRQADVKLLKRLAELYGRMGEPDKAYGIFEQVFKLKPDDADAFKAMKDATANSAMKKGGWGKDGSYRDKMKDQDQAKSLEQQDRVVKSEDAIDVQIAEIEAKLQQTPSNLAMARQLARLYRQRGNYDHALDIFLQVQKHTAGDPALEKEISDTQLKKKEAEIAAKEAALQQTPDNETLEQELAAAREARDQFVFDECKKRVERYPNDLAFKYELGELLLQRGDVKGAIEQFQKARPHPQLRVKAHAYLGQCFMKQKLLDMAVRQFTSALAEIPVMDETKMEVLYHLGLAYEAKGDKEKASEVFQQIYEVDVAYRDVAKRMGLE